MTDEMLAACTVMYSKHLRWGKQLNRVGTMANMFRLACNTASGYHFTAVSVFM